MCFRAVLDQYEGTCGMCSTGLDLDARGNVSYINLVAFLIANIAVGNFSG